MAPHQERVVTEKQDLDDKISKLSPFLQSDVFRALSPSEQYRLSCQLYIMRCYSGILSERIANF